MSRAVPLQFAAPVDLAKATSIAQPDPRNLIQSSSAAS